MRQKTRNPLLAAYVLAQSLHLTNSVFTMVIMGCSHFRFFLSIVLPLSKAVISVITLYYAVGHWNDFFTALLYLNKDEYQPLR